MDQDYSPLVIYGGNTRQISENYMSTFINVNNFLYLVSGCFTDSHMECQGRCPIKKTVLKLLINGWTPGRFKEIYTLDVFHSYPSSDNLMLIDHL